ncbi:hypothetical protein SBV1_220008 [Verrucomicrobia bacterium]|nr:hypothetical protein SBV1_220008 [Verrucomicrobiota bacterium]
MFPRVGSQILIEPGSPEDFHVMEVKNVSKDALNVTCFGTIASGKSLFRLGPWHGYFRLR